MLSNKLFQIQLRKSCWGSSNSTHTTLSVLSYVEKEQTLTPSITERDSKKIKPQGISEVEMQATTTASGSSSATMKFEPPTPTKKEVSSLILRLLLNEEDKFLDSQSVQVCSVGRMK